MASFFEDLWGSVFVAGPTSTLLVATNVTFAALQVTFGALLLVTHSIHFIILSFLCAGLWWAINWFAHEVGQLQAEEDRKQAAAAALRASKSELDDGSAMDTGDDTELELDASRQSLPSAGLEKRKNQAANPSSAPNSDLVDSTGSLANAPRMRDQEASLRHRTAHLRESIGDVGTDSEWEKVDRSDRES